MSVVERARNFLPHGRGLPPEDWARRHRGLLAVLWLHVVAVPVFAVANGFGLLHSLIEGSPLALAAVAAQSPRFAATARAAFVSVGLLSASAVLVHLSGGYIELHFHFFVMILLLALYQHWLPLLLAIGYVIVHHGTVGLLDPESVFNHPDAIAEPLTWAAIHGGFVLAASAAAVFAWKITEKEQERRRDLQSITDAVLARLPAERFLDEVLARVRRVLAADVATLSLVDEHGELLVRCALGVDLPAAPADMDAGSGVEHEIARRGEAVVLHELGPSDLVKPLYREADVRSLAGVPLMSGSSVIGVLDVGMLRPRKFTRDDLELLQLAADRLAPAIERAKLFEREHRIAETLQRSLLPKSLPRFPGMNLAVSYLPAGEGVEAGGDWYDAFELPDCRMAVAMGDVAGHGTDAAAIMGQLRIGVRAYAAEGYGPCEVIRRLDGLLGELADGAMATFAYVEIDPVVERLHYVTAGHPPPLLRGPDRNATYLRGGRRPPLGFDLVAAGPVGEAPFPPGSTLVLYTDGLVERRDDSITTRLEMLRRSLTEAEDRTAHEVCDDVLSVMLPDRTARDDAALLVLEAPALVTDAFQYEFPANANWLCAVRHALRRWLATQPAEQGAIDDLVLACGEACSNAVEHHPSHNGTTVRLSATKANGAITLSIADPGRCPKFEVRRQALTLIEAVSDDVSIERGEGRTTMTITRRLGDPVV